MVSAKFSLGFLYCIATRKGISKGFPVKCEVSVGRYYEMKEKEEFLMLMEEIVGVPIAPKQFISDPGKSAPLSR